MICSALLVVAGLLHYAGGFWSFGVLDTGAVVPKVGSVIGELLA